MYSVFKELLLPPADLIVLLAIGFALTLAGRRRVGGSLIGLGLVLFYLLSTPYIAGVLGRFGQSVPPLPDNAAADAQAIVVLAGGYLPFAPEYGGNTVDHIT